MGGDERTQLETFGYTENQTITFKSMLSHAKERKINAFWWAWEGLIDFRFLCEIRLKFIEGIIHEDHHFGALLFAQSSAIHILPQKLYQHRIRAGSTMTTWSKSEIPSYLKPLLAHFSYEKAREYFRIYSLFITVREIYGYSKSHLTQNLQADFESLTLPHLLDLICKIYSFYKDPYNLKSQITDLLKLLDSSLLPHKIKKHFLIYRLHIAPIYESLKNAERKIRHW